MPARAGLTFAFALCLGAGAAPAVAAPALAAPAAAPVTGKLPGIYRVLVTNTTVPPASTRGSSPKKPLYVIIVKPSPSPSPSPLAMAQRIANDPAALVDAQILDALKSLTPWFFAFGIALVAAAWLAIFMRLWQQRNKAVAARRQIQALISLLADRLETMVHSLPASYVQSRNSRPQNEVVPTRDFAADTSAVMTRVAQPDIGRAVSGSLLAELYTAVGNAVEALRGYERASARAESDYQGLSGWQRRDPKRGEASEVDARFDVFVTEARSALVMLRDLQARLT